MLAIDVLCKFIGRTKGYEYLQVLESMKYDSCVLHFYEREKCMSCMSKGKGSIYIYIFGWVEIEQLAMIREGRKCRPRL